MNASLAQLVCNVNIDEEPRVQFPVSLKIFFEKTWRLAWILFTKIERRSYGECIRQKNTEPLGGAHKNIFEVTGSKTNQHIKN